MTLLGGSVLSIIKHDFDSLIKKRKAEINSLNNNGKTALHWASKNGYTTIVKSLIKYKAQIDVKDGDDCTPLFFAAEAGHEKVVNKLIKYKADVNYTLSKAVSHDCQEIVKILLKNNANTEVIRKILPFAAEKGRVEVIKILLNYEKNADVIKIALYRAVDHRHMEIVKYLLAEMARTDKDFNFNEQCFYPIYFAAKKKYENVVKLLLEEKIDNIRLNHIAGKEDIEIIKFLLKIRANHFNCFIDKLGRTPLHWAAFENDEKLVKVLASKHANLIDVKDEYEETALYEAMWNGHTKIVKILLNQDANINCKNKNGWKPLHIAVISCQFEVFKLIRNKVKDDFQLNKFLENFDYHQLNNYSKFEIYNSTLKFTTLKFINIFNDLEQFEQNDDNDIDILSLYQFLLKFIDKSAENFRNQNDKNALTYLYTYTLSKICNLKFEPRFNLIINIDRYFDTIEKDIESLKDEKKQREAHRFEEEIKIKVDDAYKIVSEQIKVEVNNIINEINKKLNLVLDEIKKLMENAEDNKLALVEEYNKVRNKLILKQILEILKIVGQTISYIGGPIGIAGDVIKGGVHIAGIFISEENNNLNFETPPEIKDSLKKMEKMVENKETLKYNIEIETQLEELSQECNEFPDLKKKIQNLLKNNNNSRIIKEIKDELEQLQKKLEVKKNENVITSQKTDNKLKVIQHFNIAIENIEIATELYNKYKKDKKELDSLTYSIKKADYYIKKLNWYEENIYNTIISIIKRMQNDIYNIESKIDKKSHSFLDLTKWQVQTSLKDIKYKIQQISGVFKTQEDITYYIEKLDEGLTTLIKIYDRIQDYYDQANLARYIANIHLQHLLK
ncbi:serine/threonine-protein phosphatase 6 regulatory ankyrin repeat subunit B-like [Gigaspora margarita]|uniref:Serine/threonine-protein phosphatase 6 regulatory ankyrin repeat subunit B-like n=1 Tax=Gigaspora margarita TaxID=4874 RepID=A0A8H4EHD7_GIGMA|nr:serine/threonine-protein phosphatase 6 regulatory ankyrin repeat subunit B-like [Gigaspora margarita]